MRILILIPHSRVAWSGNRNTAERWAAIFSDLGHDVSVESRYTGEQADLLIALHGEKTQEGLMAFHAAHPGVPCIVVLTGTDLYPSLSATSLRSLEVADEIVVLQEMALTSIPAIYSNKVSVVVQSVVLPEMAPANDVESGFFDVCVVGHLREVKAPLLTARAVRSLPEESKIRVRHGGEIIETQYRGWVAKEAAINPRYHWLGALDHSAAAALIAQSDLLVLTSVSEGGPAVLGEAIVAGTPVISTMNEGAVGILGENYPGLFPVGDQAALTALLRRCEVDEPFYRRLKEEGVALADQFLPGREKAALAAIVEKVMVK